jgi:hypothetical protein
MLNQYPTPNRGKQREIYRKTHMERGHYQPQHKGEANIVVKWK